MRTPRGTLEFVEEEPARRRHPVGRVVLLLAVLAFIAGGWIGIRHLVDVVKGPICQASASGKTVSFTPEQMGNAATITAVSVQRSLPARAATIALATAMQESKLYNVRYGDRDSLGLFQQRPSQGWGTPEEILDPVHAAGAFYDALVMIDGYQSMEITKVAQQVQRSAAPEAYAQHEPEARVLASTLVGHSPAALGCRLRDPTQGHADALTTALHREYGITATRSGQTLTLTVDREDLAWSVAHWAVAKASGYGVTQVDIGARTWSRSSGDDALTWGTSTGASKSPTTITITVY